MNDILKDRELLRRCTSGEDRAAWETFVNKYSGIIWTSVQKTFRSHFFQYQQEDIEDMYNSVFVSLIENDFSRLRQYRGDNSCSLNTWLSVVTIRMTIDYMRKDKRHLQAGTFDEETDIFEFMPDKGPSPYKSLEEKQAQEAIEEAVSRLEKRDRLIYQLLCRGSSPEETAKVLDISVDNVYSRKNRIIVKLKKYLSDLQENRTPAV